MRHMNKAVLSRFIVDRIHPDWIDRLFPQGWMVEDNNVARGGGGGQASFPDKILIPPS